MTEATHLSPTPLHSALKFNLPPFSKFNSIHQLPTLFLILLLYLTTQMGGGEPKVFSLAEVSQHNSPKDCWLVIDGKVDNMYFSFSSLCPLLFPFIVFFPWVIVVVK